MHKIIETSTLTAPYWKHPSPITIPEGIPKIDRDYRYWLKGDKIFTHNNRGFSSGPINVGYPYIEEDQFNPPIFIKDYKDEFIKEAHQKLINMIYDLGDQTSHTSNVKAQMTNWFLQNEPDIIIHTFLKWITVSIESLIPEVCYKDPIVKNNKFKVINHNVWGAVYNKNDYTQPHAHGGTSWSWVYYISVPDGSSPLIFTRSDMKINIKSGQLVIFPGYMVHHVPIQKSNKSRIVLAGNAKIAPTPCNIGCMETTLLDQSR